MYGGVYTSLAYRQFRFNPHHGKDGKFSSGSYELSRAYREWRFNPNHGSDGKFSSSNFRAGAWQPVDLQTRHDELEKKYVSLDIPADKAGDLATRAIDPSSIELVNGDVTLNFKKEAIDDFGGADSKDTTAFIHGVEDLQTRFPLKGNVTIDVQPNRMFHNDGGGIVQGETIELGHGDMRFNSGGLKTDSPLVPAKSDFHGPVQPEVGPMKWTLAHEWGHAQDHEAVTAKREAQAKAIKQGVATHYGQFSSDESYAEAFAAFTVKGRDDPLAKLYDDQFHWSEKYA